MLKNLRHEGRNPRWTKINSRLISSWLWSVAAIRHPRIKYHTWKLFIFPHTCWFNNTPFSAGCQTARLRINLLKQIKIRVNRWCAVFDSNDMIRCLSTCTSKTLPSYLLHGVFHCCAVKTVLLFHTVKQHQSWKVPTDCFDLSSASHCHLSFWF